REKAAHAVQPRLAVDVTAIVLVPERWLRIAGAFRPVGQQVIEKLLPCGCVHSRGRRDDAVDVEQYRGQSAWPPVRRVIDAHAATLWSWLFRKLACPSILMDSILTINVCAAGRAKE